ncbi:uncharacterized protein DFL_003427 [Arthrobotrys flagrans]|uniref:Uncharacterized protein n=1 Tax=Arthrobotrys flagrans TaxID=97331 RepID=A0A437A1S8_ARTFL|nr:hypothetical protein DFL_003427 [Arthrobotrys flagrans]
MEDWPNILSPQFSPVQPITFSKKKFTSYNWTPPNISFIPVDESTLRRAAFDLTDMARIQNYKRRAVVCAINELNEKELRRGYQWVMVGLKCAEEDVLLIVRVVQND